jgi:subtilisin family serine protease
MAVIVGESVGVAPEARWVSCSSASSNIAVLECLQFMLAPFPQGADPLANGMPALGADVVNISLQMPRWEGDVLDYALGAMRSAGVFIATAVGNDGPWYGDGGDALGGSPSVFSVGAITPTDMVADFSSGGQARIGPETSGGPAVKPDLVAPGVAVLTAYPPDSIVPLDGTSLASPCVAGTVALLWSANPSLTGNVPETSDILRASARQPQTAAVYTSSDVSAYRVDASELAHYPNSYYGWGILDAYAAVELALSR